VEAGITTGLIAAAATAGALMGFGIRFGTPLRPFNTIAASVLGAIALAAGNAPSLITAIGLAVHVVVCVGWALAYAWLVDHTNGREWFWGVVTAFTAFVVTSILARALDIGLGTLLSVPQRIVVAVALAIALPMGMRLANSAQRQHSRSP